MHSVFSVFCSHLCENLFSSDKVCFFLQLSDTVTSGIVSSTHRNLGRGEMVYIQTDTPITVSAGQVFLISCSCVDNCYKLLTANQYLAAPCSDNPNHNDGVFFVEIAGTTNYLRLL